MTFHSTPQAEKPIIRAYEQGLSAITDAHIETATDFLRQQGWALFRGFAMNKQKFSALTGRFCSRITFDPARVQTNDNTQKVDAGYGPIGLHIENGNTPLKPDLVAFFSARSALSGSQTTLCDGAALLNAFNAEQKKRYSQKMRVERYLPEVIWKQYLANEMPGISDPDEIGEAHLKAFQEAVPGQDFEILEDGSMLYALTISPIITSRFSDQKSFANAILGPSHNYEPPRYVLEDGSKIETTEIADLAEIAEEFTSEINWQDGDVAIIDNRRVMHGRRAILDVDRELHIGMGMVEFCPDKGTRNSAGADVSG